VQALAIVQLYLRHGDLSAQIADLSESLPSVEWSQAWQPAPNRVPLCFEGSDRVGDRQAGWMNGHCAPFQTETARGQPSRNPSGRLEKVMSLSRSMDELADRI
jgi:hypothetical protein